MVRHAYPGACIDTAVASLAGFRRRSRCVLALIPALVFISCHHDSPVAPPVAPCGVYPAQQTSPYVLPFAVGTRFRVGQGNCSAENRTHRPDGPFRFAYDFNMAIGTDVAAARGGTVLETEERFVDGNRTPGEENFVLITHSDGTVGRYFHLTQHGAAVQPGETILAGQLIGHSGDTGNSSGPHLHVDVATCPEIGCATLPIVFRNTRPHAMGLVEGEVYEAMLEAQAVLAAEP